ncbi:helix-turn-helix domain-containing protein [Mesorhizobium sp. A556]
MEPNQAIRHTLNRIGERVAGIRLSRNLTQRQLGELAGSSRNTVRRLEAGETVSLDTFIRVLAALGLATEFDALLPDPSVRPVDRVRLQGNERQRARPEEGSPQKASTWAWGEETDE